MISEVDLTKKGSSSASLEHLEKSSGFSRKMIVVDALRKAKWFAVADKIEACDTTARLGICKGCGHEFIRGDKCRHRLCPTCGKDRAESLYRSNKKMVGRPNLKHLILTVKNVDDIKGKTKWIRACFTRLKNRKLFKNSWRGGLYALEYVYTRKKGWHIHIHALIDGDYIPQDLIVKHWKSVTKKEGKIVWIARAKNSKQTLKYILKPDMEIWNDPDQLSEFVGEIEGKHLVSGFGKWYNMTEKKIRGHICCPNCGCDQIEWSYSHDLRVWDSYNLNGITPDG